MKKILFTLIATFIFSNDAFALMWNDDGVIPVQSISDHRWRDGATGRLINVQGMPDDYIPPVNNVPQTGPTGTGTNGGTGGGTSTGTNGDTGGGTTNTNGNSGTVTNDNAGNNNNENTPPKNTTTKTRPSAAQVAGAVVGGALGAYGIYANTTGKHEHTGKNVVDGTISGIFGGASIGALAGAKGGWIGAALGAVAGGLITGSQLFSEDDCLYDPIIPNEQGGPTFTCCNTVFNKGERFAKIGDYMFCDSTNENGQPYAGVRQCLQGGSQTKLGWWDGLWQQDAWTAGCTERWCNNNKPPHDNVILIPDTKNFCWKWQLATDDASSDPYTTAINKLQSAIRAYEKQCGTPNK